MRRPLSILAVSLSLLASPAFAAQETPFTPAAFHTAQANHEAILVDVFASWCPICRSQQGTLKKLTADRSYDHLHIFRIEYDTQKADWQALHVIKQGTLIAFKGGTEVDRVNFNTDEGVIHHALAAAVR